MMSSASASYLQSFPDNYNHRYDAIEQLLVPGNTTALDQADSLFFKKFPGEIRTKIYELALAPTEETDKEFHLHYFQYTKKNFTLLLTCRRVYIEANRLAVSLHEHTFTFTRIPQQLHPYFSRDIENYFRNLSNQHASDVESVHFKVHSHGLEKPKDALKYLAKTNVKNLRLTVGVNDWAIHNIDTKFLWFQSEAEESLYLLAIARKALELVFPIVNSHYSWIQGISSLASMITKVEEEMHDPNGNHDARKSQGAYDVLDQARDFAISGIKLFGRPLPPEGPDARILDLPAVPGLAMDLRCNYPISYNEMKKAMKYHLDGKHIPIHTESFASILAQLPLLETLTIDWEVCDFFEPRLKTLVDHASTWVFPLANTRVMNGAEKEVELRVVGEREIEYRNAFSPVHAREWEEAMGLGRPVKQAVRMRLVWKVQRVED